MVRIGSRAPSTGRAPSVNKMRKLRDKPYKVQFESVMAKKKKLKLHDIHGSAKPLDGYTFLPVGFADLAEECKEASRRKDADVAVVSAGSKTAANDPSKLSHHIYRVGYHFRTDIFDEACNKLGYCERNGRLEKITGLEQPSRFEKTMSRYGSRFDLIDVNNRSEEMSMRVKQHIRELFPKIPEDDLQEIYERAWEQGAKTVGNAGDLSLSRQVQLATIARIRHMYTEYDHLLRVGSWRDARTAVEHRCLAKLIEWRGEHDHDPEELEEILRETIVIDDGSDDEAMSDQNNDDSDTSFEIVQSTIAPKDLRVDPYEAKAIGRFAEPKRRAHNRVPPTTIQARWQTARSERFGGQHSRPETDSMHRITVALDKQGKAPRTLQTGGIQYVRISPDPDPVQRYPAAQTVRIPGSDGAVNAGGGHGAAHPHRMPQNQHHNYNAYLNNRKVPATYSTIQKTYEHGCSIPAVQSIEKPYDAAPLPDPRTAYHEASQFVDLTTPPKSTFRGVYTNSTGTNVPYDARGQNADTRNQPCDKDDNVVFMHARPRSQAPMTRPHQSRPVVPRHHSGFQVVDLTRSRENVVSQRMRPAFPEHGVAQHTRPITNDHVHHQPVYGQAAFPQMRSQLTPAPAPVTPPRPVHGAPSRLQPVTAFGAPSPQRYLVGSSQPAYRVPDK